MTPPEISIGLDLGGTNIKYAAVDENGSILWEGKKSTNAQSSRNEVVETIISCTKEALEQAKGFGETVLCAGIGTPGLVDITNGIVKGGAPQLPDWINLPLGAYVEDATGIPVFVDNDANLMGFGESLFGSVGRCNNMIFLTLGTGIGGAIIVNGDLYRGDKYAGAELGCFMMNHDGKTGFWEDFASTGAMVSRYQKKAAEMGVKDQIDGHYIFEKYDEGEQLATDILEENAYLIGFGIAGYINIFNPEKIVIGGGVSEGGEFFIDRIRQTAFEMAMDDCKDGVEISAASLGNKAGFLGAGFFALDQLRKRKQ